MSDIKAECPAGKAGHSQEQKQDQAGYVSTSHFSTLLNAIQSRTSSNPISQDELRQLLGYRDNRRVRLHVQELRRAGIQILSTCDKTRGGYWLSSDPVEIQRFTAHFRGRAMSTLRTINRMSRAIPDGQLSFDDLRAG